MAAAEGKRSRDTVGSWEAELPEEGSAKEISL